MRPVLNLTAGLLSAGSAILAPAALADSSGPTSGQIQETAASSSYTAGQLIQDTAGNRYYQDSIYTGTVTGTPIAGTFRFDGNFFYPAGSNTGELDATFVDTDGNGNAIFGHMAGRVTTDSSGNVTDTGRFSITGGVGTYLHARGSGTFQGTVTNNGQNTTTTLTGRLGAVQGQKGDDTRPGNGFGDKNHTHTGSDD